MLPQAFIVIHILSQERCLGQDFGSFYGTKTFIGNKKGRLFRLQYVRGPTDTASVVVR